ncbi:Bax inhibitor-1/YccA family protein [Bifidobacterium coryneforme]|uniref:Bax inhibitor-1/YccA family protein n=1 Tax=Bifidobacterium coryneforme TaxID=1687 RepID=UPI0023F159E8|nr:Bax inhibitor-1 family protein [Bifidobacterium coryneforme]
MALNGQPQESNDFNQQGIQYRQQNPQMQASPQAQYAPQAPYPGQAQYAPQGQYAPQAQYVPQGQYAPQAQYGQTTYAQSPAMPMPQPQSTAPMNSRAASSLRRAENISMSRAYGEMAVGLLVTAAVAYLTAVSGLLYAFVMATGMWGWIGLSVAQVLFAIFLGTRIMTMKTRTARVMFYLYAALMGFTLSSIFVAYSLPSIMLTLVICAGFFFVLSMLGLTMRKNLMGMGSILLVGLIFLIVVQVALMFLTPSNTALRIVAGIGIVLFAGLTIYDAQQTKRIFAAYQNQGTEVIKKVSILCALNLYLDFVNLFLYILEMVGNSD